MCIIFDKEALAILKILGYNFYCNREVEPPSPDPNDGICDYWEMMPFKSKPKAIKTYLKLNKESYNNNLWTNAEMLEEMADGMFGLIFTINIDHVFPQLP